MREVCGYLSEKNSICLKEKSPEKVGQRVLEQEAFEMGNRYRLRMAKSERDGRLQDNRAAATLPEIPGQGEPRCRLRKLASQPKLQTKQAAPKVQSELRRTQEGNRRGKTLHFLEPEAKDREETTFLTQRKLKGEEGNQRKSVGWLEAKTRNPQVRLVWGTSWESQLGGMEGGQYILWTVGRISLRGGKRSKSAKKRGKVRRRAKWNQAKAKDQVQMEFRAHKGCPQGSQWNV